MRLLKSILCVRNSYNNIVQQMAFEMTFLSLNLEELNMIANIGETKKRKKNFHLSSVDFVKYSFYDILVGVQFFISY